MPAVSSRQSIPKKIRFEVFKRDGFTCQYCGQTPPTVILEIDHIYPVSCGGTNIIDNLIAACFDCNRGKSNGLLDSVPESIQERAELLQEKQDQLKAFDRLIKAQTKREERLIDEVQDAFNVHFQGYKFNPKFRQSIRVFIKKLPSFQVVDAMHLACGRVNERERSLAYFCGICWKTIKSATNGEN